MYANLSGRMRPTRRREQLPLMHQGDVMPEVTLTAGMYPTMPTTGEGYAYTADELKEFADLYLDLVDTTAQSPELEALLSRIAAQAPSPDDVDTIFVSSDLGDEILVGNSHFTNTGKVYTDMTSDTVYTEYTYSPGESRPFTVYILRQNS